MNKVIYTKKEMKAFSAFSFDQGVMYTKDKIIKLIDRLELRKKEGGFNYYIMWKDIEKLNESINKIK